MKKESLIEKLSNKFTKTFVVFAMIIFVFSCFALPISYTYCLTDEQIEFTYNGRIFSYDLSKNIKRSSQFDLNYEINKYNRFGSTEERKRLLKHMLDIGFDNEIALNYIFPNLNKTIEKIEKNVTIKERDASFKIDTNTNHVFFITPEIMGVKLDKNKLYQTLTGNYLKGETLKISVPTIKINPHTFREELERFTHLRADFSTDISRSSADRKHNVKNALNSLNKVEILPNQVFSFNKIVGRRTEENGYRTAKIIVNNEFVDGLGGGVCQVSTTLYNTALLAGLEIVEANKHSKQVSYVKYGFDAMVNFGSSDLKFRNNTGEKLTIITNYSSSKARIRIFGEDMKGVKYKLSNQVLNVVEPEIEDVYDDKNEYADKVQYEDESFILKKGSRGMEIKSFREKYVDGELVETEKLRTDKFTVQNGVRVFGTKKRLDLQFPRSGADAKSLENSNLALD